MLDALLLRCSSANTPLLRGWVGTVLSLLPSAILGFSFSVGLLLRMLRPIVPVLSLLLRMFLLNWPL
jgi:hypothetical protein